MARATTGYTPGTGALVETYPATTDGAIREAVAIVDPLVDGRPAYVTSDNRLQVKLDYSGPPTNTTVAPSTTSVQLVAADATNARIGVTLFNDTTGTATVLMGSTAAVASPAAGAAGASFELAPGQPWESPRGYVHALQAIWAATATGGMRVTTY